MRTRLRGLNSVGVSITTTPAMTAPIKLSVPGTEVPGMTISQVLGSRQRSTDEALGRSLSLIGPDLLQVKRFVALSPSTRGELQTTVSTQVDEQTIVGLEAEEGVTVWMRGDAFAATVRRLHPAAPDDRDDIDITTFLFPEGPTRGGRGATAWSSWVELSMKEDSLSSLAYDTLQGELAGRLTETAIDQLEKVSGFSASVYGARALMRVFEDRLIRRPGLYAWPDPTVAELDAEPVPAVELADLAREQTPLLIFIHGTASNTLGSFGAVTGPADEAHWQTLVDRFGRHIYAYEHPTLSQSPVDNAVDLLETLPVGALVNLVTYSRGGLVGDLLSVHEITDELIDRYIDLRRITIDIDDDDPGTQVAKDVLKTAYLEEERQKLGRLQALKKEKQIVVQRYVRVACPAQGTRLLSSNLDVFVSNLLSLMRKTLSFVGSFALDLVVGVLERVVLEIVSKRLDPTLIPGLEAMTVQSALSHLLAQARRQPNVDLLVVAGDTEGGSIFKRIILAFTDWAFFENLDNDLVVDTESMLAGLAQQAPAWHVIDQNKDVDHFTYFANPTTAVPIVRWLTQPELPKSEVEPIRPPPVERTPIRRGATRDPFDHRPIVVFLPGLMGSHLEVKDHPVLPPGDGDRVWLDYLDLMRGGLSNITVDSPNIYPEAVLDDYYGDFIAFLSEDYEVHTFPYDWRRPIEESADKLKRTLTDELIAKNHGRKIYLLAHSMGGLVARTLIARHPTVWNHLVRDHDTRLTMLGTPNHGSHLAVETLLGKGSTIRKIARLDLAHDMQAILDIVGAYPGLLQLLPRPGFKDAGPTYGDGYHHENAWQALAEYNTDAWSPFDRTAARPTEASLSQARELWATLHEGPSKPKEIEPFERVSYIFGQSYKTPCGIERHDDQLVMVGTYMGDGTVTWASGRMSWLPEERYWYLPVSHGDLTRTPEYFAGIAELMRHGRSSSLPRLPAVRGAEATTFRYLPPPEPFPTKEQLESSIMGRERKRRSSSRYTLKVQVRAMDVLDAAIPLLVGHYQGDPISGVESRIDTYLLQGALRRRSRVGQYPGRLGTSEVVLMPRTAQDKANLTGRGAIVVGLGTMGDLSAPDVTLAVRTGVLDYLFRLEMDDDALDGPASRSASIHIASLLLGFNSTARISIDDSVTAIVTGVCQANREYRNMNGKRRVESLSFVEVFIDSAVSAAHAVRALPDRLASSDVYEDVRFNVETPFYRRPSARRRLRTEARLEYWPRIVVQRDATDDDVIRFLYLSQRARADERYKPRQMRVVKALVNDAVHQPKYDAQLCRSLFDLLIPRDFKPVARNLPRVVIAVDDFAADLPWELMQADDEPTALRTNIVRQLISNYDRPNLPLAVGRSAFVVAAPSIDGHQKVFDDFTPTPLPGAEVEGKMIAEILRSEAKSSGLLYQVDYAPPHSTFKEVFRDLYRGHRILAIAAHGVFEQPDRNGDLKTGILLSDGVVLTANELADLEEMPELVFLNCCHLGRMDATFDNSEANTGDPERKAPADQAGGQPRTRLDRPHHFAASVSRELIASGVRCVIAAGWAVEDRAAQTFAVTFFQSLMRGATFAESVRRARVRTYHRHPGSNTWGAYQAYGDPDFILEPRLDLGQPAPGPFVAREELVAELDRLRDELGRRSRTDRPLEYARQFIAAARESAPSDWFEHPDVLVAIGQVYADRGLPGFEEAQKFLTEALQAGDERDSAKLLVIEKLANLEARSAETLSEGEAGAHEKVEPLALVNTAINRLVHLLEATRSISSVDATRTNPERLAVLASAYKRRAVIRLRLLDRVTDPDDSPAEPAAPTRSSRPSGAGSPERLAAVEAAREDLKKARDLYQEASGDPQEKDFRPYQMINWLQLEALLVLPTIAPNNPRARLAKDVATRAGHRYAETFDFWEAVDVANAYLAASMFGNDLDPDDIVGRYVQVTNRISKTALQFDSVIRQIRILATLAHGIGRVNLSEGLSQVANQLDAHAREDIRQPSS